MNTFDISKNIILAFIILISVALKLSAHENTTSLISSDNVSIEKDKKTENTSKRNVQNKTILCYERNKKDIFKDYILHFIYMAFGALLSWLTSHIIECKRKKSYLKAIKKELEGNKDYLTKKFGNDDEEKLKDKLDKNNGYFIHLSDFSWNQYKYVIGDKDKDKKISEAYMLIGEINILVHASFYTSTIKTIPLLVKAIIEAKGAIDIAILR